MIKRTPIEEVVRDFVDDAPYFEAGQTKTIAENTDFGVEIWLGGEVKYGFGLFPTLTVFADGDVIFDDTAYTTEEFRDMLGDIYENFLSPDFIDAVAEMEKGSESELDDDPPDAEEDLDDEIEEQESLLGEQVQSFLTVAYGTDPLETRDDGDTILEKLKDAFCEAAAGIVGEGLYRPGYVEDEKGRWVFERYPYEEVGAV